MTSVVNPASFQILCARLILTPMKLGTSHWFGVGGAVINVDGVAAGVLSAPVDVSVLPDRPRLSAGSARGA